MNKIKILYVMGGNMHRAGAETMIMNYVRQLVKYQMFDISVLVHGYEKGDYDNELSALGIRIIQVPIRSSAPFKYKRIVRDVFTTHKFEIVHCNMDASSGDFLEIAKKSGVPIRIVHSHTTKYQAQNIIKKIIAMNSKRKIPMVATHFLACSKKAGDWMFRGKEYLVLNNAIDLDLYRVDEKIRKQVRKQLSLQSDIIVLGHIGRFCFEKNHEGLIRIFKKYHDHNNKSVLLCIGDGPTQDQIKELVKRNGLCEFVKFLGIRSDIPQLLQAMDVFLLPSLFEGLPVVGIEAQAAGLPCLFSEAVTEEVCILDSSRRIPLDDDKWIDEIDSLKCFKTEDTASLAVAGYSIQEEAKKLKDYYMECLET